MALNSIESRKALWRPANHSRGAREAAAELGAEPRKASSRWPDKEANALLVRGTLFAKAKLCAWVRFLSHPAVPIDTDTNRVFSITDCGMPSMEHVCTDLVAPASTDADRKQIVQVIALV